MQAGPDCRNEKLAIIAPPRRRRRRRNDNACRSGSLGRDGPQNQRRRHQPALQLGAGPAGARHDGSRFRGTGRLSPAAPVSAEPGQAGAGELGARRAARLRRQQHPLRHLDEDRRMGARQAVPVGAARPRPGADPVGFRLGRRAPQALYPLAQARELQGGAHRPARHGQSRVRADGAPRQGDCVAAQGGRRPQDAGRRRHYRAADAVRAGEGGLKGA